MSQINPTEIAKQFSLMAGSLTFLGFFLPQLFEGIPPVENLLLTVIAAAVMSILGWKFGLIWGEPLEEKSVLSKQAPETHKPTALAVSSSIEGLPTTATTDSPNTTIPSAGVTENHTDVVSVSIPPEEAPNHSWEVNGTGDNNDERSRNREA